MECSAVIHLQANHDIVFQQVGTDCCVYIRDIDSAAVLNATAACVFLFLNDCLKKNRNSVQYGEILKKIEESFRIPSNDADRVSDEIEQLISRFCEVGLYVEAIEVK